VLFNSKLNFEQENDIITIKMLLQVGIGHNKEKNLLWLKIRINQSETCSLGEDLIGA